MQSVVVRVRHGCDCGSLAAARGCEHRERTGRLNPANHLCKSEALASHAGFLESEFRHAGRQTPCESGGLPHVPPLPVHKPPYQFTTTMHAAGCIDNTRADAVDAPASPPHVQTCKIHRCWQTHRAARRNVSSRAPGVRPVCLPWCCVRLVSTLAGGGVFTHAHAFCETL